MELSPAAAAAAGDDGTHGGAHGEYVEHVGGREEEEDVFNHGGGLDEDVRITDASQQSGACTATLARHGAAAGGAAEHAMDTDSGEPPTAREDRVHRHRGAARLRPEDDAHGTDIGESSARSQQAAQRIAALRQCVVAR